MAQVRVLRSALLLLAGALPSAAAFSDEQALVQRNAAVQQELEAHDVQSKQAAQRQAFAAAVRQWTSKVKEAAMKLEASNITVGMTGAVCTEQELSDYKQKVEEFKEKKKELSKSFDRDFKANVSAVFNKTLAPLFEGGNKLLSAVLKIASPIAKQVLKSEMVKVFKPKRAYNPSDVVEAPGDLNAKFKSALSPVPEMFKAIYKEEYAKMDALLNESVEALPSADGIKRLVRMAPLSGNWTGIDNEDYIPYLTQKLLPILAYEVFPVLAMPLSFLFDMPGKDKQEDFFPFAQMQIFPVIGQMAGNISALADHYRVPKEDVPQRLCHTCQEKYTAEVNQYENGCVGACVDLLNSCATAVDTACTQDTKKCVDCQRVHLESFDACLGDAASHSKSIGKFRQISQLLDRATTSATFDEFLTGLAKIILS